MYKLVSQTLTETNKELALNTSLQVERLHVFFAVLSDSNTVHSYR